MMTLESRVVTLDTFIPYRSMAESREDSNNNPAGRAAGAEQSLEPENEKQVIFPTFWFLEWDYKPFLWKYG